MISYPLSYQRRNTRIVQVGKLKIGGKNPIRVQSMITAHTADIAACIQEIKQLIAVRCELIRITIPTRRDLESMSKIRELMVEEGLEVPLIADIHFAPQFAVDACEVFEKIRINPGNFSDRPKNNAKQKILDYEEGKNRLKAQLLPLVKNLKKYNRALRIGVNHGSLSTRMIEKFGDSPLGMVHSALEIIALCEDQGFDQIILSLKSSNPLIVQRAYRLFIHMSAKKNAVPLHLGVTEAGDGPMARIKSIAGIGSLLADGIGDTIRVSLTEPSTNEIPFAYELLKETRFPVTKSQSKKQRFDFKIPTEQFRFNNSSRSIDKLELGKRSDVKFGFDLGGKSTDFYSFKPMNFKYRKKNGQYFPVEDNKPFYALNKIDSLRSINRSEYSGILVNPRWSVFDLRILYQNYDRQSLPLPCGILIRNDVVERPIQFEVQLSSMLSEGMLDFILFPQRIPSANFNRILLLLQATRTIFLLQTILHVLLAVELNLIYKKTTKIIKEETNHLIGVKIGIMGCIVNGPGEMADADFGYVGSGPGKIDLYLGHSRVKKSIPETLAVDSLIQLIKDNNKWKEL